MTTFLGLHPIDLLVIAAYFALVLYPGKRASRGNRNEDGFFLANRSLGKLYQFFLNFGQSTDAQSAVSTASVVYQQGISGVWLMLQTLFINPYYWFMHVWFRRARLTTVADLFENRLGSRSLARFYAIFQIITAVVVVNGFSNLIAYKISASMMLKPEAAWTSGERQSVADYREMKELDSAGKTAPLAPARRERLNALHEADARGELHSYVSALPAPIFYLCYILVVGLYIVLGGMHATARNEALQGSLTLVFSALLIPAGLAAAGGWHALSAKVPAAMLQLFGGSSSEITGGTMLAILFVTIVAAHANINNMSLGGSARNEYAARFGAVSGTYAKRIMIILWGFAGLIAIALYQGSHALSDPDIVWGTMARQLLGPGLLGLMLAGVLAGNMSTGAMHTMAISGLFVRNVYRHFRPGISEKQAVTAGRWAIVVSLALGVAAATVMTNAFSVIQLFLLMNVPFGAAVLMIFMFRRLTSGAVWSAVIISALATLIVPSALPLVPALARQPALLELSTPAAGGPAVPIYFESAIHSRPDDLSSPLQGHGRFHAELYLLRLGGLQVGRLSSSTRFTLRFALSGLLPFFFLIGVSRFTRRAPEALVDQFYGKMKTPVGETPALEAAAMAETARNPHRFDHRKLLPRSAWEFTKWDRVDGIGFLACCGVSGGILLLLVLVLRLF